MSDPAHVRAWGRIGNVAVTCAGQAAGAAADARRGAAGGRRVSDTAQLRHRYVTALGRCWGPPPPPSKSPTRGVVTMNYYGHGGRGRVSHDCRLQPEGLRGMITS
jgi:hypothetical protein